MDPMKAIDPRPNTILIDENGGEHPVDIRELGVEEVLTHPEVETTFVQDDLYDGVVPANAGDTDGDETLIVDMDIGKAGIHLSTDGEVISARDENGKPIAGRYKWGSQSDRITDMALNSASKEELAEAIAESREFIDARRDVDGDRVYHPDAYERQAQMIAVEKTTAWIKQHPGYSLEELKAAKAGFLTEARCEIRRAIAELEDKRREELTEMVHQMKERGISNEEIATALDIPESTVREYAK